MKHNLKIHYGYPFLMSIVKCFITSGFVAAFVCVQVLPAGGAPEALRDYLLEEHQHRNLCGDLQPHQGANGIRNSH